jgi:hypothetical protein
VDRRADCSRAATRSTSSRRSHRWCARSSAHPASSARARAARGTRAAELELRGLPRGSWAPARLDPRLPRHARRRARLRGRARCRTPGLLVVLALGDRCADAGRRGREPGGRCGRRCGSPPGSSRPTSPGRARGSATWPPTFLLELAARPGARARPCFSLPTCGLSAADRGRAPRTWNTLTPPRALDNSGRSPRARSGSATNGRS